MQDNNETFIAALKGAIVWLLVAIGSLTAAKIATYLAIAYTSLQIFVTVRDKILRRKPDGELR